MSDEKRMLPVQTANGLPEDTLAWNAWTDDDAFAADEFPDVEENSAADQATSLSSLGYIGAALKRSAWVWCFTAIAGLIIGLGLYIKFPPAYQATITVVLTNNPTQDPTEQITTDASLADSQPVAGPASRQLGLHQSVSSFIGSYTVTVVTPQVLTFTVNAPSSSEAVRRASALAAAFLQFHAQMAQSALQFEKTQLDLQFSQAQKQYNSVTASIKTQISLLSSQPVTPATQDKLTSLQQQLNNADNNLYVARSSATGTLQNAQIYTAAMVQESSVLNSAAPLKNSFKKGLPFYAGVALLAGLFIGLAIVIIRALVSDRLRRRDDIAVAIAAPIRLSVPSARFSSRLPAVGVRAARRAHDMRRIVVHLSGVVPRSSGGPASLAVVAVDNSEDVARAVKSFAVSYSSQGRRVIVADLSRGAHAARMLKAAVPGVSTVSIDGQQLEVAVPHSDDVAPVGPLLSREAPAELRQTNSALAAEYANADLVLTLATMDPAIGGDYLATWASDVVAIITAGRSSAARVRAVGEMIRLAGARIVSVVVMGADRGDESLGANYGQDQPTLVS